MADATTGSTYDILNLTGELFLVSPSDTPLVAMAGGIGGVVSTNSPIFTWGTEVIPAAAQQSLAEGKDPTYAVIDRTPVNNVTQIHQYGTEITYTKQSATGRLGEFSPAQTWAVLGNQPVQDEVAHQVMLLLRRVARDFEYNCLQGAYQLPADNTTGRQTRGLKNAISTHTVAAGGALTTTHVDTLLASMANGNSAFGNMVFFCGAARKQDITKLYAFAPDSRNVGGVNIEQIETDFAKIGVVWDRFMPTDEIYLVDMDVIKLRGLPVEGKSMVFAEPLAQTGAAYRWQVYADLGLEYGPEEYHGSITGIT